MRYRIYKILLRNFGFGEGEKLPWYLIVIKCLLFPVDAICYKYSPIKYDLFTDTLTIDGVRYSRTLFRAWALGGLPLGQLFRIISRENGVVTIEKIDEEQVWRELELLEKEED